MALPPADTARPPAGAAHCPPVTVLKPLKGPGVELDANLESFCRQDYPVYQIVFGVDDARDPAVEVVRGIMRRFPHLDIALAIGHEEGANRKVANLVHMMRHARHDVLVLSDADIRVRPDYLRTMVAPLADPTVGLTTCLYRGHAMGGFPAVVESLLINTDFLPMVLMAQWVQRFRYAYGASIAFRRDALDMIGGFEDMRAHLADDYLLGTSHRRGGLDAAPAAVRRRDDSRLADHARRLAPSPALGADVSRLPAHRLVRDHHHPDDALGRHRGARHRRCGDRLAGARGGSALPAGEPARHRRPVRRHGHRAPSLAGSG